MEMEVIYPDVLGAVSDNKRFIQDTLQYAVGIFPLQAYINQPVEVVVILQSIIDQDVNVRISLRVPTRDPKGNAIRIQTADLSNAIRLKPGEVGIVHIPIAAQPPTRPGKGFPVRVMLETRVNSRTSKTIRPPDGGPPPSVLDISAFKLNVLKDIKFVDNHNIDVSNGVPVAFDIASKALPGKLPPMEIRYEKLWGVDLAKKEQQLATARIEDARRIAYSGFKQDVTYRELIEATEDRFAIAGIPLHPGEAKSIARMMIYTVEDAPTVEKGYEIEKTRWFRALCQLLAHDTDLNQEHRAYIFAHHLYDAIIYDAIRVAFRVVQSYVDENLGNQREKQEYATRVLTWLTGNGTPDLNYVYLPLAMGGLMVNPIVQLNTIENPWIVIDELREAYQGRVSLIEGETIMVFDLLAKLLDIAMKELKQRQITRP